jgi:membrane-associated protease RseP (regulator of RpoE activity)
MSKYHLLTGPAMLLIGGATLYAANQDNPPAKVPSKSPPVQVRTEDTAIIAALAAQPDSSTAQPAVAIPGSEVPKAPEAPKASRNTKATGNAKATGAAKVTGGAKVTVGASAVTGSNPSEAAKAAKATAKPANPTRSPSIAEPAQAVTTAVAVSTAAELPIGSRWIGMKLEPISGIGVSEVASDSMAARYGLQPGDVLLSVDGRPLNRVEDLAAAIRANRRPVLQFTVLRNGQTFRMLVDQPYRVTKRQVERLPLPGPLSDSTSNPRAAVPASRAIRIGTNSFSCDEGGVVLVQSSVVGGTVDCSAVFRDASGASRNWQFSGSAIDLECRLDELPETLQQVVRKWLQ